MSGREQRANEGFGNSQTSDSSTESMKYYDLSTPTKPVSISSSQESKSSSSSEDYMSFTAIAPTVPKYKPSSDSDPQQMSFHNKPPLGDSGPYAKIDSPRGTEETEIRDGHQVQRDTQNVNKEGEINKGFTSDSGSSDAMEPPNEILTGRGQCPPNHRSNIPFFPSFILARKDYSIPFRPQPLERHPPTAIQPPDESNKRTDTNFNREHCSRSQSSNNPFYSSSILARTDYPIPQPPDESIKRTDRNFNPRRFKALVIVVCICLSVIVAVVVTIVTKKNIGDPKTITPEFLTEKCNNQESVVSPGDRICIPYDDLHSTSRISHITIQQTSSAYSYNLFQFNMSVNSTVSNFTKSVHDWIVDYDISRIDQMLRLVQPKAYCSSTGNYSVILEYHDGFHTSFEFEVRMRDPQLHQNITFDDQEIHVHCELTGTCLPGSLAIYVNVDNSSFLVPDTNACSYNDKETGTMVSIQATIPSSMYTTYQSISCVPLMRNQELAENLTNTKQICLGPECKPNCKDASATNMYYPNSVYCDKYYQCSNGEAIEKPCSNGTYWESSKCTCDHYNATICDTNKRITPLRTLNPCG